MIADFVDLQINGYAGVDFNADDLDSDRFQAACEALYAHQVRVVLPTIITDTIEKMSARISRLVSIVESLSLAKDLVKGIHIEGPFISPEAGYVGAHPRHAVQPACLNSMKRLLDAAQGLTRIVTLAPEQDMDGKVTSYLANQGLVVAAGHTNATRDQLHQAINNGLTLFTHLGNGCPRLMDRHDNIVQRVLSFSDQLWISFIADGAHVPYFALENYWQSCDFNRVIIVTDAISAAGCGPGRYQLGDQWVQVGEDGVPRAEDDSHLVGSGSTMQQMINGLRANTSLSEEHLKLITSINAARMLELSTSLPPQSESLA